MRSHGKRVFIADDDREMRQVIADVLRRDGYDVQEAGDCDQLLMRLALARIDGHPTDGTTDLIITDVRMPFGDGLDLVQALREAHWTTPIVVMTAFGDRETRERVILLGAVLLDKPFPLDVLRQTVRAMLP